MVYLEDNHTSERIGEKRKDDVVEELGGMGNNARTTLNQKARPFNRLVEEWGPQTVGGGHPCHLVKRIRKICIVGSRWDPRDDV